jgi:glycosyltransferase involved in cell wall biosynthesis
VQPRVAAVVPAKDEEERLAETLAALQRLEAVDLVVVVDDGSTDRTAALAAGAGAVVVRHPGNEGKAAALASGAAEVARLETAEGTDGPARALLFVDADLRDSAANLGPLCDPVVAGTADMSIAVLPPQLRQGGGFGLVVRLARTGVERLTGWTPTQPLSGMRCLTREAFEAAQPLARGWGVEVGLTVDVLRAGRTVVEVPCELHHRVTGRDLRAQLHRARQYRDVWWALARRGAWTARRP